MPRTSAGLGPPLKKRRWSRPGLPRRDGPADAGHSVSRLGALDRDAFATCVARVPVPTRQPGRVAVLDDLAVHPSAVRAVAAGYLLGSRDS